MIIEKILNNNVIVTHDKAGREVVAMGRGLAFGRHNGDRVDDAQVDKVYRLRDPEMLDHFKELVAGLNPDYMDASNAIIEHAQQELGVTFDDSIYISLTDHIHMAIHRIRKGIAIHNMMLWETKRFYPKEFAIAEKSVAYLSKRFGVDLPEDEAGFVAMHLIDAQSSAKEPMAARIVELIAEITNIVRLAGHIEYDKDSLAYYRFVTHLKFFAKRMLSDTQHPGEEIDADMASMIAKKYALAHDCIEKVAGFLQQKYGYTVSEDVWMVTTRDMRGWPNLQDFEVIQILEVFVVKQWNKCKKTVLSMGIAAMCLGSMAPAEAAANFLAEVPAGDWSYAAANELITAGVVPEYTVAIPDGRVLSRLEMAMIADCAAGNEAAMTDTQRAAAEKLKETYYYDIKKLALLDKIDALDESKLQAVENGSDGLTKEERAGLKKAADLAERLDISGYARIRNDHYLTDKKDGTGESRSTRANMIYIEVDSTYKVNKNWQAHTNIGYRNSLSGFEDTRASYQEVLTENKSGFTWDTFVTGRLPQLGLDVKFGKWNEWNPYGWGMDIDCDFEGFQFTQGKKQFKTYFTAGQMDLWDDAMGGTRNKEKVTSLRFFYPFDAKSSTRKRSSRTPARMTSSQIIVMSRRCRGRPSQTGAG